MHFEQRYERIEASKLDCSHEDMNCFRWKFSLHLLHLPTIHPSYNIVTIFMPVIYKRK